MIAALLEGLLGVLIEKLPDIEQQLGRAAFLVEAQKLVTLLHNGALAVQAHLQRLRDLMQANDAAVDAAATKDPPPGASGK